MLVVVLVSGTDASALAGGVWAGGGALLAVSAFRRVAVFRVRGIVARSGCEYRVTVAAEMDMYPKYMPWVYITPCVAGARDDGKLRIDVGWQGDSTFADLIGADLIGAVVLYIEGVCGVST
jgi:hypothetical protein